MERDYLDKLIEDVEIEELLLEVEEIATEGEEETKDGNEEISTEVEESIDTLLEELDKVLDEEIEEENKDLDVEKMLESIDASIDALLEEEEGEVTETPEVKDEGEVTENTLEEKTIVKLDRKAKLKSSVSREAMQIAKKESASLYAKWDKANKLRNKIEVLLVKKHKAKALKNVKAKMKNTK